jgi:hypothetical protein
LPPLERDRHDHLPAGYDDVPHKLRLLVADVLTEEIPPERDVSQIIELANSVRVKSPPVKWQSPTFGVQPNHNFSSSKPADNADSAGLGN